MRHFHEGVQFDPGPTLSGECEGCSPPLVKNGDIHHERSCSVARALRNLDSALSSGALVDYPSTVAVVKLRALLDQLQDALIEERADAGREEIFPKKGSAKLVDDILADMLGACKG